MALDPAAFATITPSQYITFTLPNPLRRHRRLHSPLLRVAVLDSPTQPAGHHPRTAAMLVPLRRESDWIFSTVAGHLQLLLGSGDTSRLILIGNTPASLSSPSDDLEADIQEILLPLVISLSPKLGLNNDFNFRQIPFLSYDDGVLSSVVVELCRGDRVGEMLVEEVKISDGISSEKVEFRRRLRFKRTPNLIQTQIRISHDSKSCENGLFLDTAVLVQPYLVPMVASISLISTRLEEKIQCGFRPKALCLGVGGGALLSFLNTRLGFEVVGVEEDEAVLGLARQHFGLPDNPYMHVHIGDALELIKKFASVTNGYCLGNCEFDVVMVDLDSSEVGVGTMAPPMEFVEESVLFAMRAVLSEDGIVVVNVIPTSKLLYDRLVGDFRKVFHEVYEIDVEYEDNFVLIASKNPIGIYSRDSECGFLGKLREAISGAFMESIRKI